MSPLARLERALVGDADDRAFLPFLAVFASYLAIRGAYYYSVHAWFADQFVPWRSFEERRAPDISPMYAGLSSMPAAIFTVGTEDPLLDDTLFMEARWRAAGNATELRIWPEAPHGFISLPMSVADLALAAEHEFLRRTLAVEPAVLT